MCPWKFMTLSRLSGTSSTLCRHSVTLAGKSKATFTFTAALSTKTQTCRSTQSLKSIRTSSFKTFQPCSPKFRQKHQRSLMTLKTRKRKRAKIFTIWNCNQSSSLQTKPILQCSPPTMARWTHPLKIFHFLSAKSRSTNFKRNPRNLDPM